MNQKQNNGGFSLVEVLVSIVILGVLVTPVFTSMVVSSRMNVKTTELLQAQLAVSSAVETLMAEGITEAKAEYDKQTVDGLVVDNFPDVKVETKKVTISGLEQPYFEVIVTSGDDSVTVTTYIRKEGG